MFMFVGTDHSLSILEFMAKRPFTRTELSEHLQHIGHEDPFYDLGTKTSHPHDRIMWTIRRRWFATYSRADGRWHPNLENIEREITYIKSIPHEPTTKELYAQIAHQVMTSMATGPVTNTLQ